MKNFFLRANSKKFLTQKSKIASGRIWNERKFRLKKQESVKKSLSLLNGGQVTKQR